MPAVLLPTQVEAARELQVAERLRFEGRPRLGRGEAYAAAIAVCRGGAIALDDRRARSRLQADYPQQPVLGTVDLIAAALERGHITTQLADALLDEMETLARFKVNIRPWHA